MLVIVFRPAGAVPEDNLDKYLMVLPSLTTPEAMLCQLWTSEFRLAKIFHDPQLASTAFGLICKCQPDAVCARGRAVVVPPSGEGTVSVMRIRIGEPITSVAVKACRVEENNDKRRLVSQPVAVR